MKIRNLDEFKAIDADSKLQEWEDVLSNAVFKSQDKRVLFPGHCQNCDQDVDFIVDDNYAVDVAGKKYVNYRERLVCPQCQLNNRMRALIGLLGEYVDIKNDKIYLYEQVTPMFKAITEKSGGENIVGSEYLGEQYESGYISPEGVRHEDAMKLSFADASFKAILSNDVFEHVMDIKKTIKEAYRVLEEKGVLLTTVPFYFNQQKTQKRAEIKNGQLVHLQKPIYHGDPMNVEKGCLVIYDYGWDLLDLMRDTGFSDVYFQNIYSPANGNIGVRCIMVLVAIK